MTCSNPRFLQASQRHVHTKPGSTPPKWKAPCRTVLREFIAGVEQLRRTSTWIEVNPLKVSGKNHGSLSARNRVNLEVVELQIKLCLSAWGSISNFPLSMPCISAILCRASARSRLHCEFFEPGWGGPHGGTSKLVLLHLLVIVVIVSNTMQHIPTWSIPESVPKPKSKISKHLCINWF
jgi:hypothetical protein